MAGDARRIEILKGAQDGLVLQHLSPQLQDDPAVVLAACNQNGNALQWASVALKADREVVLAACNQYGLALRYASDALQADREVVLTACNQNGMALHYASAALRKDDCEMMMVAVAQSYRNMQESPHNSEWVYFASFALRAEFRGDGILTHVRDQLQLRSSFFGIFLCAIALPAPAVAAAGARCLLPRLDVRSGSPIKMLIADFAGVPHRSSWRFVQLAAAHLTCCL